MLTLRKCELLATALGPVDERVSLLVCDFFFQGSSNSATFGRPVPVGQHPAVEQVLRALSRSRENEVQAVARNDERLAKRQKCEAVDSDRDETRRPDLARTSRTGSRASTHARASIRSNKVKSRLPITHRQPSRARTSSSTRSSSGSSDNDARSETSSAASGDGTSAVGNVGSARRDREQSPRCDWLVSHSLCAGALVVL